VDLNSLGMFCFIQYIKNPLFKAPMFYSEILFLTNRCRSASNRAFT
jgi:hypothetical protein